MMAGNGSRATPWRAGFTMIEVLLVMVVFGILVVMGIPRMRDSVVRASLRSARGQFTAIYQEARSQAMETGRATSIRVVGNVVTVTAGPPRFNAPASANGLDTIRTPANFNTAYSVAVTFTTAQISINPRGLASSGSTTVRFARQGLTDSVMISGFGRLSR